MLAEEEIDTDLRCFHCGHPCEEALWQDDKSFCCYGCKTVYEILSANQLCEYYDLDKNPGLRLKDPGDETFQFLEEKDIAKKILEFDSANFARVRFFIPAIHCMSCIWLLENLNKIEKGVLHTEVNFAEKKVQIDFDPGRVKLSALARLLSALGYLPKINLDTHETATPKIDRSLALKVSVAGFCFGNVMLFSFPEYLGLDQSDHNLSRVFSWLNLVLSIPVFFYSGWDYLQSASKSFRQRQINIDVPIAAGLLALFLRSSYDIITATGPGYFDSFTGLVFFLLIGRWFQGKTYQSLAFNRDYTAYFPLAVNHLSGTEWKPVVIYKLQCNDVIRIRNMEIIPADSTLLNASAYVDYSFVTGESKPVKVQQSELIYAGGRLIGPPVEMVVTKQTSQSHLTSLWNNDAFRKIEESKFRKVIDLAAQKFTWVVLFIASATSVYWYFRDPAEMWLILTAVLMVACPCALALAAPFTFGSMLRVFGRNKLYLKNADVIERMAAIDVIVFDKTGTVTHGTAPAITFTGKLNDSELGAIKLLTGCSTHPLSNFITNSISGTTHEKLAAYKEIPGKGIEGIVDGRIYKIGSAAFTGSKNDGDTPASRVFVSINGAACGYFTIKTRMRRNIASMLSRLKNKRIVLLSGDHNGEEAEMRKTFGPSADMRFNQTPQDKLDFIRDIQQKGKKVLMVGDGLNDAGALKQSDVGIAVTDDTGVFTPASDGILYGEHLQMLDKYLILAAKSSFLLRTGFAISFFYNAIALSVAVTGNLTPLVAAILMPVSSISVVGFSTLAVNFTAKRQLKNIKHDAYELHNR